MSRQKALTFRLGILLLVGDCPIRQLVLYHTDFGRVAFLGVEPGLLVSLWLKASAIFGGGGEITSAEGLLDWGGGP
jgi:hypothetical protein